MDKKNRFIRFFKDKSYRWLIKEKIILWFMSRSIVIWIITFWMWVKFAWRVRHLSRWEQYIEERKFASKMDHWNYSAAVFTLLLLMRDRKNSKASVENFERLKKDILECDTIKEPENSDFREWLEQTDYNTEDISYLEAYFNTLIPEQQNPSVAE